MIAATGPGLADGNACAWKRHPRARCCRANGKLYTVLRAQYTGCATEETPAALYFGALDLENDPLAGEYREQVLGRLRRRITGLVEAKPGPERDAELAEATKLLLALR